MKERIQTMKCWIKCVSMVVILVAGGLCGNSLLQAVAADEADPFGDKHVLVIGIDGCRSDALQAAKVPNLTTLIDRGTVCYQVISGGQLGTKTQQPTSSGPGWSSILTGVWRDKHGISDNKFAGSNFNRVVKGTVVGYPHFFTRIKQIHPECHLASIVNWAPIHEHILSDADYQATGSDDEVAERCVELLRGNLNPAVIFLQFDDTDAAGHSSGFDPANPAYLQSIETADRQIGTILEAIRKRPSFAKEDWLILVTSDHGGLGKKHGGQSSEERTVFLIASGGDYPHKVLTMPWSIVAIAPTVFRHLGIPVDPSWGWQSPAFGTGTLFANQPNVRDANPQLDDPVRAFENIPQLCRKLEFRQRNVELPGGGHFQGVQSYFAPSLNKQICFLSRDSDSQAYFITVAFDPGQQSCGEIRHVQYLPSDGNQPPLRHPGGMQLIGRYLVIGVEDSQNKCRSQVQFWDVSNPFAPKQRSPLTVIRESTTPKDKTAGAVGIVRCAGNHLLVVANWDAKALDFYVSNGLPLDDDACRFTFKVRWTDDDANKAQWKPNDRWGNYQGVNLVCDRDFNVYLFEFCTTNGKDRMDLFSADLSKDPQTILRKLSSKRILLHGGAHFQYSGGISILSSTELSCYASERDDHDVTNVSVSP